MKHILLTGATGFLGKVVLSELLRRKEELQWASVTCLIRPRRTQNAQQRFAKEIKRSRCFAQSSALDWSKVSVVEGDLGFEGCGLKPEDVHLLRDQTTHVIHCAASIDFDLPIEKATLSNVTSALNMLELAKSCEALQHMVSVSTAYVNKPTKGSLPIDEKLVPLKKPASRLLDAIHDDPQKAETLIAENGYPNSYTFTKCLTEHLLVERKAQVPLSLVRPSIVSAALQHPVPAWIDSQAAFAAFVSLVGGGYMRALKGKPSNRLDIVPVDVVADRIINRTFEVDGLKRKNWAQNTVVLHAVAGPNNSERIDVCCKTVEEYFQKSPLDRQPKVVHLGPRGLLFRGWEALVHQLPSDALTWGARLTKDKKLARKAQLLKSRLLYTNQAFENFTHNEYHFTSSAPLSEAGFNRVAYIENVCRGVRTFLWRKNPKRVTLAGESHIHRENDLVWAGFKPKGNLAIRTFGYLLRKMARQGIKQLSFDEDSFREALAQVPPGHRLVVVPTHRSYTDFLVCSYLFFERPDLGVSIPYIAAAEEFSKIPVLGELFKHTHAFYIKRGQGKEDVGLSDMVNNLIEENQTLQFFIEGTRSRSRQFLKPRRGLMRALQNTGANFAVLPVSISYENLPEEDMLLQELRGNPKPKMQLSALLKWTTKLIRGDVHLGQIHAKCGAPCVLNKKSDVPTLANKVMAELQKNTVATEYHLRAFLMRHPQLNVSLADLKAAIQRRGGEVLSSTLQPKEGMRWEQELCLRYQWQHWFYGDVANAYPSNPALSHHLEQNQYHCVEGLGHPHASPELSGLLRVLMAPVVESYRVAAQLVAEGKSVLSPQEVVRQKDQVHLPFVENAFNYLVAERLLARDEEGRFTAGEETEKAQLLRDAFAMTEKPVWMMSRGEA
ncbi:MAG: hypothetical protein CMH56_05230 [Myxococcales bacterium]|nr:hypothetical protein [Myxococcales bacterium]